MEILPDVFVGNIGLRSVTLCGVKCKEYLKFPNSRFVRECVIIEYETEEALINSLQSLILESIPFESTYKSQAAKGVLFYRKKGLVKGEIITIGWGVSGAIYDRL